MDVLQRAGYSDKVQSVKASWREGSTVDFIVDGSADLLQWKYANAALMITFDAENKRLAWCDKRKTQIELLPSRLLRRAHQVMLKFEKAGPLQDEVPARPTLVCGWHGQAGPNWH